MSAATSHPTTETNTLNAKVHAIASHLRNQGAEVQPLADPEDEDGLVGVYVTNPRAFADTDQEWSTFVLEDERGWVYTGGCAPYASHPCLMAVAPDADAETVAAEIMRILTGEVAGA